MAAQHQRWEHKVVVLPGAIENALPEIEILGEDGWEMVQVLPPAQPAGPCGVWFKRRKVD